VNKCENLNKKQQLFWKKNNNNMNQKKHYSQGHRTDYKFKNNDSIKQLNDEYPYMSLSEVKKYLAEAEQEEVSVVSRTTGYMKHFLEDPQKTMNDPYWKKKRNAFIARHKASYDVHPTKRRRLALIMWAYEP